MKPLNLTLGHQILFFLLVTTGLLLIFAHSFMKNDVTSTNILDNNVPSSRTLKISKDLIEIIFHFNSKIFIIDPNLLMEFLNPQQSYELQWRFNLNLNESDRLATTFGIFDYHLREFQNLLKKQNITVENYGSQFPFNDTNVPVHIVFQMNNLTIHVVVFYHVEHFLWIGQMSPANCCSPSPMYGKFEQIFDPFKIQFIDIIPVPDDIEWFLSQLPTSRYLHCPIGEKMNWFTKYRIELNEQRIHKTIESIVTMKSLMRALRMEFWIMCGTLLGWFRHCHPIPYTTDTDLSTWSKYFQNENSSHGDWITDQLKSVALKHGLNLFYRFGEPSQTLEYSFRTQFYDEKIDLFVTYDNDGGAGSGANDSYLIPSHITKHKKYRNYRYPRYELCSITLLGHKLLAPCQTEQVIIREYGEKWNEPIKDWNYVSSPFNGDEIRNFSFPIDQYTEYRRLYKSNELVMIN